MADDVDLTGVLRAIAVANEHMQAMYNGDPAACFRYLKTLLDTNDVVVSVYQEGNGVGLHMIKGRHALGVIFASGNGKNLSFSAIPCTSWEQAIAVEWTLGDSACRRATLRTVTNAFAPSAALSAESFGASYRWRYIAAPRASPATPTDSRSASSSGWVSGDGVRPDLGWRRRSSTASTSR